MTVREPSRPPCRCGGSGALAAVIPLSDAVMLDGRPCPDGCTSAPPATGTPKIGYGCNTCLDWGTITTVRTVGDGVTSVSTVDCPVCRTTPAATADAS